MQAGLACTLGAGLLWGLVFVAPVLLPDYPALYLSAARYLAFGLIALLLVAFDWRNLRRLETADWWSALELALIGNLMYYTFLASAIQIAGAPLPSMIIGALPVIISIASNFHQATLPWRRLALPLSLMAGGIALVQRDEWNHLLSASQTPQAGHPLLWGGLLSLAALACWTWYPIRNARWLQRRPSLSSTTWATAQGLATLPLALLAVFGLAAAQWKLFPFNVLDIPWQPFPTGSTNAAPSWHDLLGPQPLRFLGLMLAIGLGASWLGTLLWNRASQLLPASLAGQLIVFETLAAMLYAYIHRGQWPGGLTWMGIVLLIAGVILGVRAFRTEQQRHQT